MSTRSIIRVKLGGAYRVCQYVQSDGYPTWRGVEVLLFTRDLMEKGLEEIRAQQAQIRAEARAALRLADLFKYHRRERLSL